MSPIQIIKQTISRDALRQLAKERYGDMVKAVVDVRHRMMAVGPEMHADAEDLLLSQGSRQADLWGINLYPDRPIEEWVEFDSMINIRPAQGNRSRSVEDKNTQSEILQVVSGLVQL